MSSDFGGTPTVKEGDVIAGKYVVERVIGVGGMGVVVAAMHLALHQRVAIKLMLPAAAASAEAVHRFVREARAAAQLRSDHVARVLDVGTLEGGEPYMVMELLDGHDLDEILRQRQLVSVNEAVDYVRQACDALAEAHQRGIVHRDLKPGNLFLATDARGRTQIKVLDFGISKATATEGQGGNLALTKTTTVMGSPLYMSPEQMRATRNVDARTDIWSLGVTLYQLLTGRVPFLAESPMELGAKVLHEEPPPPDTLRPEIPPSVVAVVLRCLMKDPAQRFASAMDLAAALERAVAGAPLPPTSTRVTVDTGPLADALPFSHTALAHAGTGNTTTRTRSRGRPILFVGVALLAAGIVTASIRSGSRETPPPVSGRDVGPDSPVLDAPPAPSVPPPVTVVTPPPAASELPAPPAPTASAPVPARGRSPAPPPAHRDRPRPPASAPEAAPPAPSPSTNPLDHM